MLLLRSILNYFLAFGSKINATKNPKNIAAAIPPAAAAVPPVITPIRPFASTA